MSEPLERLAPLPPSVRLTATYPATDGSAPETVEVVWEAVLPGSHTIVEVIEALARVTRRYEHTEKETT